MTLRPIPPRRNFLAGLVTISLFGLLPLHAEDLPPDTTEPMGQSFGPEEADTLRVALVGSGSSHDFPRWFLGTDAKTLKAAGGTDTASTPNLEEALELMKEADVLLFSGNHGQYGSEEFQQALHDFADAGKGIVLLHAATWSHPWKGYNDRFVAGRTPSHGRGDFEVTVTNRDHKITDGLPETFTINDENYRFKFNEDADFVLLAVNEPDQTEEPLPSAWVVNDPKTRIVCITLGHDGQAHNNEDFKKLLVNSVKWVGKKDS